MERGKEDELNEYRLQTTIRNKDELQTTEDHSRIWCDRLGNHVIIKFKHDLFYFNHN